MRFDEALQKMRTGSTFMRETWQQGEGSVLCLNLYTNEFEFDYFENGNWYVTEWKPTGKDIIAEDWEEI
jgi:hypothetical protein